MYKFYKDNKDYFLKYFEHSYYSPSELYDCLLRSGNFKRMNEIIKEKTSFNFEAWKEELAQL